MDARSEGFDGLKGNGSVDYREPKVAPRSSVFSAIDEFDAELERLDVLFTKLQEILGPVTRAPEEAVSDKMKDAIPSSNSMLQQMVHDRRLRLLRINDRLAETSVLIDF